MVRIEDAETSLKKAKGVVQSKDMRDMQEDPGEPSRKGRGDRFTR